MNYIKKIKKINCDLNNTHLWFKANKLKLNIEKTQFIIFSSRNKYKPASANSKVISFNDRVIKSSAAVNYLGVTLDPELNFNEHASQLCNKISRKLGSLSNIKFLLPEKVNKIYLFIFNPTKPLSLPKYLESCTIFNPETCICNI